MSHPSEETKTKVSLTRAVSDIAKANPLLAKAQDILQRHVEDDDAPETSALGEEKVALPRDDQSPEDFVESYINKGVENIPLRLIDLDAKKLIEKPDLVGNLKASQADFVKMLKAEERAEWGNILKKAIGPRMSFAIFSHRWGEDEPLLAAARDHIAEWLSADSDNASPGIRKLVHFCAKAKDAHQLHLAWSDTCCIDKTSSAELQEAINSMFQWYRASDLCIAHLAETEKLGDVKDGKDGWRDAWFKRGWTLQELIAPRALKFYTKGWDRLVKDGENDKEDKKLLEKLQAATGIKPEHIKDFTPGPTHLREKMIWASQRITTRGEDIAYSLLGIFGVGMHISYGEGSEEAFYRLQEQIIQITRDRGLFDWYGDASKRCSMLASYPRCFRNSDDPDDEDRREQLEPVPAVRRSFLTKFLCLCTGCSCLNACMVQTFSCAVRVEVLVSTGEVINKAESHFSVTNNGLQLKADTIRVLHKWPLRRKGGYRRLYLTSAGHKRVKVAFVSAFKKTDEFILVPITDDIDEREGQRKAQVAVLLYKVDSNTWTRAMTKGPIFLKRNQLRIVTEDLLHTIYIR